MKPLAFFLIILVLASANPARSEESSAVHEEQIRQMEKRLARLQEESDSLRRELEALKSAGVQSDAPPVETEPEDLTAIDTVDNPAPPVLSPTPKTADVPQAEAEEPPIEVVSNQPNPGLSKIFNPDISVIGNFIGKAGDENLVEDRPSMTLDEVEIAFQAAVDPYAKANFFVAFTPEGAELEEGYLTFTSLPFGLTAKVGKMLASFGKINLLHPDGRPWIDQPLVISNFMGDEGLNDSGISASKIFPNRFNLYVEGTGEVFSGHSEGVFEPQNANDLFYLAHLRVYRDLTENSNLEVGGSLARGTTAEIGGSNSFRGLDLTFRYRPLRRSIYRSFISRTEVIVNAREDVEDLGFGFYTSVDYQFARRWFAGMRLDRADHVDDPSIYDRGASLTLTFWPSEFSQVRAQARRTRYGTEDEINELLLQVQFSIGRHGVHAF